MRLKILVIEPDSWHGNTAVSQLADLGHEVTVHSPEQAKRWGISDRYEVLIAGEDDLELILKSINLGVKVVGVLVKSYAASTDPFPVHGTRVTFLSPPTVDEYTDKRDWGQILDYLFAD